MKKIVTALLGFLVFCAACHKNNTDKAISSGYWTIDHTKYSANYITRKDTAGLILLSAQDSLSNLSHPSNSIAILLGPLPADSGSFQVLSQDSAAWRTPGPGQLTIFGSISDSCGPQAYLLSPYDNLQPWTLGPPATVKVVNGKINVVIPPLLARVYVCSGDDSLFVSASIQEH
jgi:hypothetical protein